MVRWLHISDLHIVRRADWINFEKELIKKCREYDKIDLVIVTGDFHNFSEGDNFCLARDFLQKLLGNLELDIERDLFIVPGNHDGVSSVLTKNFFIRSAKNNPFEDTEQWVEGLLVAFEGYENFVRELIPHYPVEHPASVHNRTWRNQINFIHCNTALAADGKEKDKQLLDVDALAETTYMPDMPNILLAHNSFFDLHQKHQQRVKDTIRANSICAYFCGDWHKQEIHEIPLGREEVPCVVSYRSAPDPQDDYSSFGIILGEWEGDLAELRGWSWESGQGFIEDPKITGKSFPMRVEHAQQATSHLDAPNIEELPTKISVDAKSLDPQIEEYTLERLFITNYYQLTRQQCTLFNQKHGDMPLALGVDSRKLSDYVNAAQERGVLSDLVQDLFLVLASD